MMRGWSVPGAIAVALVGGCSGPAGDPSGETTGRASSAIQGGTEDTADGFTVAVVSTAAGGSGLCTGVLLAPNVVATARHCVAPQSSDAVDCATTTLGAPFPVSNLYVSTDTELALTSALLPAVEVIVPTGAWEDLLCGNDIAVLILSKNIELPQYAVPALDPRMTDHAAWATTVTAIGYGEDGISSQIGTLGTRRILQGIPLQCIPNDTTFADCYADPTLRSTVAGAEFVSGAGPCVGDSGSGAFDQTQFGAGKWVAFGVLSRGDAHACAVSVYTRFDSWKWLLVAAAQRGAQLGGYAVPAWAAAPPRDAGTDAGEGGGKKGGCGVARGPTQPVPWGVAAVIFGAMALARRLRTPLALARNAAQPGPASGAPVAPQLPPSGASAALSAAPIEGVPVLRQLP
jgi:hypothetical protein